MTRPVIIVGAGGHAVVVADALMAAGREVLGFTDADEKAEGRSICGLPVLGDDSVLEHHSRNDVELANGIGGTRGEPLRREVQTRLQSRGWTLCSVRHPSAVVSPYASVGLGVHLMAACVVQPRASLGAGCIVNTGAVVEHDALIGDFVHIAPGAIVCGWASIGDDTHVGAGGVIRQGLQLGPRTLVGAGAVVTASHPGGIALVGVPARPWRASS